MDVTMDKFLKDIEKHFGPKALTELDDDILPVSVIPTGVPSVDLATGVGGLPRGRIIEIFGPEGSGKTTLAIKVMAEAQKNKGRVPRVTRGLTDQVKPLTGRVGLIDMEHAFDPSLAKIHGLQTGKDSGFYLAQPDSGVQAMELLEYMVGSGLFDVVTVDSVASLVTDTELDASAGDQVIASVAQLMSFTLRRLTPMIAKTQTLVIFINQVRDKPGVAYGATETTPGGRALKFHASMRIRVNKKEPIVEGTTQIGHRMKVKIVKNKVAPPYGEAEVDLYYRASEKKGKEAGFDIFSDFVATAQTMGVVQLAGSQYRFIDPETGEVHKAQGLVAWKQYLTEHPDVMDRIMSLVLGGLDGDAAEQEPTEGQDVRETDG